MPQFSRAAILASVDTLMADSHSGISHFLLVHGLENALPGTSSKRDRLNELAKYLFANADAAGPDGQNLTDAVVRDLVTRAAASISKESLGWGEPNTFEEAYREKFPELTRSLDRDGFHVIDWELKRSLPEVLDLRAADDDVHRLLDSFGFDVPKGHLDQALQNHSLGNWAAANGQLRSFLEGLINVIAECLEPDNSKLPGKGWNRAEWLAKDGFFLADLNEWKFDQAGRPIGFIPGIWQRLHPQGSHPGLSDVDDSTFRLHFVLLLARLLLQRLKGRTATLEEWAPGRWRSETNELVIEEGLAWSWTSTFQGQWNGSGHGEVRAGQLVLTGTRKGTTTLGVTVPPGPIVLRLKREAETLAGQLETANKFDILFTRIA